MHWFLASADECTYQFRIVDRFLGSYYENIYTLMCLGIPSNAIPVLEDGNLKNEDVVQFIAKRRALEEQISG